MPKTTPHHAPLSPASRVHPRMISSSTHPIESKIDKEKPACKVIKLNHDIYNKVKKSLAIISAMINSQKPMMKAIRFRKNMTKIMYT